MHVDFYYSPNLDRYYAFYLGRNARFDGILIPILCYDDTESLDLVLVNTDNCERLMVSIEYLGAFYCEDDITFDVPTIGNFMIKMSNHGITDYDDFKLFIMDDQRGDV